ncbi:hypothetical protein E4U19_004636 [Claviceps sp. Clav32 group G5]|nr:hypothetical protein E4U19_004636 [Claviceps sp. Clav32 group G5]
MGSGLLTHANDPNVTYEAFCQYVANAAYTQERAHREQIQRKKAKAALLDDRPARHDDRPARRKSYSHQPTVKKEARVRETYRSGHRSPDRARSD